MSVYLQQFIGALFIVSGLMMIATAGAVIMYRRNMTVLDRVGAAMLTFGGLVSVAIGFWSI